MSFNVFFDFSEGLSKSLAVPKGTFISIMDHVRHIESVLGFQIEQFGEDTQYWKSKVPKQGISDEIFCNEVEQHNQWVQRLYKSFGKWSETHVADGEMITPEDAKKFWHALTTIDVPPERWTDDYYRARMETIYEVMRGRETEGISFDEKPLTPKQAAAVIRLFEQFLDPGDLRLDVPKGCDYLASSSDGGYVWCEKCGAVTDEHIQECRKRGCPPRKEWRIDE